MNDPTPPPAPGIDPQPTTVKTYRPNTASASASAAASAAEFVMGPGGRYVRGQQVEVLTPRSNDLQSRFGVIVHLSPNPKNDRVRILLYNKETTKCNISEYSTGDILPATFDETNTFKVCVERHFKLVSGGRRRRSRHHKNRKTHKRRCSLKTKSRNRR